MWLGWRRMALTPAFLALVVLSSIQAGWSIRLANNGTLYSFSCNGTAPAVLLYFKNFQYVVGNSSMNVSLADSGIPSGELKGCNSDTKSLAGSTAVVASVALGAGKDNMTFDFHFRRTNGKLFSQTERSTNTSFYWELLTIVTRNGNGSADHNSASTCFVPKAQDDWVIAPRNFSFSCHPHRNWIPLNISRSWRTRNDAGVVNMTCSNSSTPNAMLNITGLQIQAFDFTSSRVRFDDAIDCVGYVSGPTIMGFIVGFLLLSVLFITSMIFLGMQTPRFSWHRAA